MRNERPIPPAALRDENAVELLRIWVAERKLHCSIKVGMYRDGMKLDENRAWGVILADVTRHISSAMHGSYGDDPAEVISKIRDAFISELDEPTPGAAGDFLET